MGVTVADIKRASSNATRRGYAITANMCANPGAVRIWLREIMLLEAAIRRYAAEHGVTL